MIDANKLTWKKIEDEPIYQLYLGNKKMGEVFWAEEDLWWIRWPDGVISADYYNLTRAKDNLVKHTLASLNNNREKPPTEAH